MNRRRELFLQKLEINQRKTNQQKKAKQKAKNTVVGDLHEIKDALTKIPQLTTDISESITKTKKKCRRRKRKSAVLQKQVTPTITDQDMRRIRSKRTQKYMLSDIAKLQSVLKDKSFKRNSKELILKNLQEQLT
uniref:Uncharacterized protein n=1 Tax=Ciona savignyi TaxID=51511 RepID=H2Z6P4_CIOSA